MIVRIFFSSLSTTHIEEELAYTVSKQQYDIRLQYMYLSFELILFSELRQKFQDVFVKH